MAINPKLAAVLRAGWPGGLPHTKNGPGSIPAVTAPLVAALPAFLRKHGFTSVADLGCGDLSWARLCDWTGIAYTGYDFIQPPTDTGLVAHQADILKPQAFADVALARHVMIHLTNRQAAQFLDAINAKYLLATHDTKADNKSRHTRNIHPSYSPINLTLSPFSLNKIDAIKEVVSGQELALFRIH